MIHTLLTAVLVLDLRAAASTKASRFGRNGEDRVIRYTRRSREYNSLATFSRPSGTDAARRWPSVITPLRLPMVGAEFIPVLAYQCTDGAVVDSLVVRNRTQRYMIDAIGACCLRRLRTDLDMYLE